MLFSLLMLQLSRYIIVHEIKIVIMCSLRLHFARFDQFSEIETRICFLSAPKFIRLETYQSTSRNEHQGYCSLAYWITLLHVYTSGCKYDKGSWSKCNVNNEMTRADILRNPNESDVSCEKTKIITKKCKNKTDRNNKGTYTRPTERVELFNHSNGLQYYYKLAISNQKTNYQLTVIQEFWRIMRLWQCS